MKAFVVALAVTFVAASFPTDADARRFGGGGSSGMQRSMPPRATPDSIPAKPAATNAQAPTAGAAAAPAAAAAKRSWMGPIAGLAAGLGIAALLSHLGLGAEFANMIMLLLLGVVAFLVIRMLMRRFMPARPGASTGGLQFAGAGAGAEAPRMAPPASFPDERPLQYRGLQPDAGAVAPLPAGAAAAPVFAAARVPAGFDTAAFERIAKMIFIRLQAANDAGDLNDLRAFTTPEMFAAIKLELQERGATAQQTDVVRVDAQVLEVVSEADRQIVSVRFHGLIREESEGVAEPFDEIWHLVKPADGSREWAIAGIQQTS